MKLIRSFIENHRRPFLAAFAIAIIATLFIVSGRTSANTSLGSAAFEGRKLRVVSTTAPAGGQFTLSIELDSEGDEVAASFTLNFDPTKFSSPVVALGTGAPAGTTLNLNTNDVANGRLGVLVFSSNAYAISAPPRQMITVTFNVAPTSEITPTPITFVQSPTPLSVSSIDGVLLFAQYELGIVTIIPAPTFITVGGKVTSSTGQNLRNAVVSLIDGNNVRRTATTGTFGQYNFENVVAGGTYTLTVSSKRYRFAPRQQVISASISNMDFVGLE